GWISFNQFKNIKKIGEGGFAKVYSAEWINGPLHYDKEWKRGSCKKVALKCLNKSQNKTEEFEEFLNEIKVYSMNKYGSNIIKIYGISQDPKTKNYIIVLQYAEGNILFEFGYVNQYNDTYISDMGLCGEIGNVDKSKIYGVMSYLVPEVLRGKPYTKAADIYSFGIIMYFVATGRQPFSDRAHDKLLTLDIYNRPDAIEVENIIYSYYFGLNDEIKKQFKEAEEYRKINISSIEISQSTTHSQASNISRLLNPFTEDLPSECLDCSIAD
ncbi:kinase-like domain-containing protein, partial [Rhizophagus diaphanus]